MEQVIGVPLESELERSYIVQFTGGDLREYLDVVFDADLPLSVLGVGCVSVTSYDEFTRKLKDAVGTASANTAGDTNDPTTMIHEAGGVELFLHRFDSLPSPAFEKAAAMLKGVWTTLNYDGDRELGVIATVDDPFRLRDLSGDGDMKNREVTHWF